MSEKTVDLGPHLNKAQQDHFDYAMGLKNGDVFKFLGSVTVDGEWLVIDVENGSCTGGEGSLRGFPFPRGLQVRISEIAWFADAPHGS